MSRESEVDVGNLNVSVYLQFVDFAEVGSVEEVKQVLPVHKRLKPLVAAANQHLETENPSEKRIRMWNWTRSGSETHVKVLPLREGQPAELSLLVAPLPSSPAVSHHNALLHSGVHVEGDVLGSAHHQVEAHPGTPRFCQYSVIRRISAAGRQNKPFGPVGHRSPDDDGPLRVHPSWDQGGVRHRLRREASFTKLHRG